MQTSRNQERIKDPEVQVQDLPDNQSWYQQLAWTLYTEDRLEEVHTVLHEALLLFPEDPELYYLDGLLSKKVGLMKKACRSFSKVIELTGRSSGEVRLFVLHQLANAMLDILADTGITNG